MIIMMIMSSDGQRKDNRKTYGTYRERDAENEAQPFFDILDGGLHEKYEFVLFLRKLKQ
jgi:hypothetical protein